MNPGVIILLVVIGIGAILYATGNLDFMFKDDDKKPKTTTTTTTPTPLKPPDPDPDPDAPSKGHKVRITHVDAFDPDAPSDELQLVNLSQVEVYDSSDKNVSSGKTVTGLPGTWDGHSFASLVDGDTSTVAHTKGTGVHSMTIDLGKETEIDSIVITNRADCCRPRAIGIRVEILDDDDKVVKTTRQIAKNAKKYTYDFTATNPVWEYTDEEPYTTTYTYPGAAAIASAAAIAAGATAAEAAAAAAAAQKAADDAAAKSAADAAAAKAAADAAAASPYSLDLKTTDWNDRGGGRPIYLNRHHVYCNNDAINQFRLKRNANIIKYEYNCLRGINSAKGQNQFTPATTRVSSGSSDTRLLRNHDVNCNASPITDFVLREPGSNQFQYQYRCSTKDHTGQCRNLHTPWNDRHRNNEFLDRHDVKCGTDEALTRFKLVDNLSDKMRYDYTCCKMPV